MKVNDIFVTDPDKLGQSNMTGYYSYVYNKVSNNIYCFSYFTGRRTTKPTLISSTNKYDYFKIIPVPEDVNTETFRDMLVSDDIDARNYAIEIIKQYE